MSSPKEKAQELFDRYETLGKDFTRGVSMKEFSKQCALIAVDEMLGEILENWYGEYINIKWEKERINYWQEVKQEIEQI
jgi:hypothetical protein